MQLIPEQWKILNLGHDFVYCFHACSHNYNTEETWLMSKKFDLPKNKLQLTFGLEFANKSQFSSF